MLETIWSHIAQFPAQRFLENIDVFLIGAGVGALIVIIPLSILVFLAVWVL